MCKTTRTKMPAEKTTYQKKRRHFVANSGETDGTMYIFYRVLKGPGVSKGKRELGNPKDSVWEDWGTLGKIRGITSY